MKRQSLLIDTNLLILLVVGSHSVDRVANHRRLEGFAAKDFHRLADILSAAQKLIVTPNILTETSNLLGSPKNPFDAPLFQMLSEIVRNAEVLEEIYIPSAEIAEMPQFPYLGLTDSGILSLKERNVVILTRDMRLASECWSIGLDVLPFELAGAQA